MDVDARCAVVSLLLAMGSFFFFFSRLVSYSLLLRFVVLRSKSMLAFVEQHCDLVLMQALINFLLNTWPKVEN